MEEIGLGIIVLLVVLSVLFTLIFSMFNMWLLKAKIRSGSESVNVDMVRRVVRLQKHNYKIVRDVIEHEIEQDGTSVTTRAMEIEATSGRVSWIEMGFGATAAAPGKQSVKIEYPRVVDENGMPLRGEVYEESDRMRRMIIFLPRPAEVGGPSQKIRIMRRVVRGWVDLVERKEDFGIYEVQHEVEELAVTVRVPRSLRISQFAIIPSVGKHEVAADHLSATWSAKKLGPGQYRYSIRVLPAGATATNHEG